MLYLLLQAALSCCLASKGNMELVGTGLGADLAPPDVHQLVGGLNLLVRKVADLQRLLELIHGLGAGATSHHHVQQGVVSLRLDLQRLLQPEGPRGRFSSHTERWSAATNAIKLGEQRTASSILSSISPAICTSLHCAHCCHMHACSRGDPRVLGVIRCILESLSTTSWYVSSEPSFWLRSNPSGSKAEGFATASARTDGLPRWGWRSSSSSSVARLGRWW
mmetsp:Transcript_30954/g.87687  ORF Transcript_30954/g.87687 Transcript_30954/m.87687 type:complete len:221 (+) Transcript_30954:380-1042(+)